MNSKLFPHYNSIASSIKVTESNSVDSICFNSNEDNPNLMDVIIKHKEVSLTHSLYKRLNEKIHQHTNFVVPYRTLYSCRSAK